MINKGDLRAEIKLLFKKMTPTEKTRKSVTVFNNLHQFLKNLTSQNSTIPNNFIIGVFAPMDDEVEWMLDQNKISNPLAFPCVGKNSMVYKKSSFSELQINKDFGVTILGPNANSEEVTPDIAIIPGRAFSRDGKRLGRGKGFYDRYLKSFKGKKIGLCFEDQIYAEIPTEDHDIKMDFIVTDKNIYSAKAL